MVARYSPNSWITIEAPSLTYILQPFHSSVQLASCHLASLSETLFLLYWQPVREVINQILVPLSWFWIILEIANKGDSIVSFIIDKLDWRIYMALCSESSFLFYQEKLSLSTRTLGSYEELSKVYAVPFPRFTSWLCPQLEKKSELNREDNVLKYYCCLFGSKTCFSLWKHRGKKMGF